MGSAIARHAAVSGTDPVTVAAELVATLGTAPAGLVLVFADWRLDASILARDLQAAFGATPVVGCTTVGIVAPQALVPEQPAATAIAIDGGIRVGIGIARDLSKAALIHSRDAVEQAAAALGATPETLIPSRNVMMTIVDGTSGQEEAFCIGVAALVPQLEVVGGSAGSDLVTLRRALVWTGGEVIPDAGLVIAVDSPVPFYALTSTHLQATDVRTVVTAASGRTLIELDGRPAAGRLRELFGRVGIELGDRESAYSFARYVDGVPYVRSIAVIDGGQVNMASGVEVGHVLHVMRAGDLIGSTRRDLAMTTVAVGGTLGAFIAFSCVGRHWYAREVGLETELAAAYAECSVIGFHSFGEQTGILLVNHTLTALAFGVPA